ncbi:GGDEF domain-containing protein [Brucella pseudogrignonensis]|uniref:Diguanylate cyclase (GGDEF)-like protein n=1 Tax=Brucella pseudogrignonensis TaxID=419475 RepID=A0ABU1MF09_9HYPH|nr:GGDEF domain-containing protein [Brucella pseudogrignonensis]MDR6434619.1 diguanylate cyclase (GGDEF)-like protein [Brucella pseudogrignonensis]
MSHAISGSAQARQRAWYLLAVLMLCWSAVFGTAMFLLAYTREPALLINAAVLAISVSSAITSRNAATPRIAFLAILFVTVPFLSGVFLSLDEEKWIVFVVGIPLLLSSYSLTSQNHQILVRLIWAERQARALAYTDVLTGLPNRLSFACHQETLASLPTGSSGYAYMCLDLDGFKKVNDHYGHPAGDLLLKAVAVRLRQVTRSSDIVFRIGGDEFIVYMPGASSDDCAVVASRIVTSLGKPFSLSDDLTVSIGCSAGSACLTIPGTAATILHVADEALYKAKREGKSRHVHSAAQ